MFKNLMILLFFLNGVDSHYRNFSFLQLLKNIKSDIICENECYTKLAEDEGYKNCRELANKTWNTENYKSKTRNLCCYEWDIIDCTVEFVIEDCFEINTKMQYKKVSIERDEWVDYFEKTYCEDYKFGSVKCQYPDWALTVFCCLVISIIIICAIYFAYRKFSRRQSHVNEYEGEFDNSPNDE
jgi:hypothetical protein